MSFNGFDCIGCGQSQPADYAGYICPTCGHNLQVTYDYASLKTKLAGGSGWHGGRDDIFKYLPLLPLKSDAAAPVLRIGPTRMYEAERLGACVGLKNLLIKDDGLNPSGSFKDRASAIALAYARENDVGVVAGASTGNAGSSMACLSASVGFPCVIFVPEKAPAAKIAQLLIFGANVLAVQGTYDEAFDLCHDVCKERGWFNRNTGYNPFTREGKKTGSLEILDQLNWEVPDRVIIATGDGNIISGIWKGFTDAYKVGLIDRLPKIDCAQSLQSNAVSKTVNRLRQEGFDVAGGAWDTVTVDTVQATTLADSISVDLPRDGLAAVRAVLESGGEAIAVDDQKIMAAMPEIAQKAGVFVEPSAATTYAALKQGAENGLIDPEEKIVCFFTGNGLKDVNRAREAAGEPVSISTDLSSAMSAVDQLFPA